MSLFAQILGTIGEVAIDAVRLTAVDGVAQSTRPRRKSKKHCTPCEAVRRVEAASQQVQAFKRQVRGGK